VNYKNAQQKKLDDVSVRISEIFRPAKRKSGRQKTSVKSQKLGGSIKQSYCDSNSTGFPNILLRKWRSPAVGKECVCKPSRGLYQHDALSFAELGLTDPTFTGSSGGTCELSSDPNRQGLYCPSLDYGGFINARFYHDPPEFTTTFRSSVWVDAVEDGWYHVVFTRNGAAGAMYINGGLVSVGTLMSNINGTQNKFLVGAVNQSTWSLDAAFNGRIDQISVLDFAVAQDEVDQLFNSGDGLAFSDWDAALTSSAEYVLEFPVDGQVTDRVGNANTYRVRSAGTVGGPGITASEGKISTRAFTPVYEDRLGAYVTDAGAAGSVLTRNYRRHAIEIPKSLGLDSWTLSAWISPHGRAVSYGESLNISDPDRSFNYNGTAWQATSGAIFSDYNTYSGTSHDSNFQIFYSGKYKHPTG